MRANLTLKREIDEEKNLSNEKQCHGTDEHKRAARPPGLPPPIDRIGEVRVATGNLTAPNFEKLAQPIHRLRAVRPQQTQAQKGQGLSNGAEHAYITHRHRPFLTGMRKNKDPGRYASSWMVFKRMISNSLIPAGVCTLTSSPTFRPRSAFPIGEVVEINPSVTSASSVLTSLYSISMDFLVSSTQTREPYPARSAGILFRFSMPRSPRRFFNCPRRAET